MIKINKLINGQQIEIEISNDDMLNLLMNFNQSQPERSKREDLENTICDRCKLALELIEEKGLFCKKSPSIYETCFSNIFSKMRCSEHCGNTVKEAQ
jgi:hypothetical protein